MTEAIWNPASAYMQPLQLVVSRQLNLDIDDIIALAINTKGAVQESMQIFGVELQGDIDLEALEDQAHELYAAAASDSSSDTEYLDAFIDF